MQWPMMIYCFILPLNSYDAVAELSNQTLECVKASFILDIVRFVTWPAESFNQHPNRLLLCMRKSGISGQMLKAFQGETVGGNQVDINQIDSFADTRSCNVLYIANDEFEKYTDETLVDLNQPLLTILDVTQMELTQSAKSNTLVTLVRKGSRIGFEINLDKTRHSGLRMSSELLKLATIIDGVP